MTENAAAKGRRYLIEGRLLVTHVDGYVIRARCRGSDTIYHLGYEWNRWHCDCPARGTCAHLHALQLVTITRKAMRAAA